MKDKKCYICDETKPEYFNRCEKHDVCLSCGKHTSELGTMNRWGTLGGFRCQDCEEKRIQSEIENFQKEHEEDDYQYSNDGVICPYCGYLHKPDSESSYFYNDGDENIECSNCGNEFNIETYISYSYTTTKKENK